MATLLLLKSMLVANALSRSKKKVKKSVIKSKPMKKLRKGIKSKCRICDEEDGEIPIFNNIVHPNLSEDIHHFSGVRMENEEGRSKFMCQNCLNLLNGCLMFREMCQKSNKKILNITIKKETNVDLPGDLEIDFPEPENENGKQDESDSSFNIPSPNFSEDCTEVQDIFSSKEFPEKITKRPKIPPNATEDKLLEKPEKYFLCDVCGKTAKSNANLLMHKSIHEEKFPFKCDKCPYRGRSYGLLKVHKTSHLSESELPYRCTQCPKATTTSSNLAKHIRNVHSRDNKNRFKGRTQDLLKVHQRSHLTEAERPYKCPHCPKATTSTSNLSKHIRHMHNPNKVFKCTYCERAFSFQHDMKRHIKEIHLRQGTVECNVCFKKFNTRKILRGHQYKIHKMKGARQGRLPAYLQAQMGAPRVQPSDDNGDIEPDYTK